MNLCCFNAFPASTRWASIKTALRNAPVLPIHNHGNVIRETCRTEGDNAHKCTVYLVLRRFVKQVHHLFSFFNIHVNCFFNPNAGGCSSPTLI